MDPYYIKYIFLVDYNMNIFYTNDEKNEKQLTLTNILNIVPTSIKKTRQRRKYYNEEWRLRFFYISDIDKKFVEISCKHFNSKRKYITNSGDFKILENKDNKEYKKYITDECYFYT